MIASPSSGTTIERLVELHRVLTQLSELRHQHDEVPESMRELHDEHGSIQADIARLDAEVLELEQTRRVAEGAADDAQQKIDHYQQQINLVSTQREYGALLSEIDTATTHKKEQEETGLTAIERQDEAGRERQELAEKFEQLDSSYRQELEKWEKDKPEIASSIAELEARSEVLKASLSAPVRTRFELLYERHEGNPMARIDKVERTGSGPAMYRCSVCNYSVRPQLVVEIQTRGDLVACDCGRQRIFYLETTD